MLMEDTIAAISTPIGVGGIGIVRMSGSKSVEIIKNMFRTKDGKALECFKNRYFYYGKIVDSEGKTADEVLVVVMRAPNSYTKEDIAEIHCHGGIVPLRQILRIAIQQGARLAQPGEFTKRAFLNGRIDLAQAEGVMDLICAKTESAAEASIQHMEGILSSRIRNMRKSLIDIMARIEVAIDYPEEDIEELETEKYIENLTFLINDLNRLLSTADTGKLIRQGIKVVIVGKPNVGKSSLLNALLRENRAIVTDIPGTTRDVIEESLDIDGVLVRILDTAGIRKAADIIEDIGINRSRQSIKEADLVLWVMDASGLIDDEDLEIAEEIKDKNKIIVLNKIDKQMAVDLKSIKEYIKDTPVIKTSAILGQGIPDVEKSIHDMVMGGKVWTNDEVFITNIRHQEALIRAGEHIRDALSALKNNIPLDLVSIDVREACDALGTITGETVTEDLLDKIFSEFCLGK